MGIVREKIQDKGKCFETHYQEYFPLLYRFLYRLTGDMEEAKDIAQESFVKLHNFLQRGFIPDQPKAWIFKVATNTCYSLFKRKARFRSIVDNNWLPNHYSAVAYPSVEDQLIQLEMKKMIRKAIEQLSVMDRLILELHHVGLSYKEISMIVKVKTSSIGKKLFRIRKQIVEILKDQEKNISGINQ